MRSQGVALTGLLVGAVFFAPSRPLRSLHRLESRSLSAVLDDRGFLLEPSGWGLSPGAWGRRGSLQPLVRIPPHQEAGRVRYTRPGILEWHEARPEGIEQGFEVLERPEGPGPLVVEQEVRGELRLVEARPDALSFGKVEYRDLKAFDARGRALPARMTLEGRRLSLVVEDGGAAYPVSIDPLSATPSWSVESSIASTRYAWGTATAGDVDGDGYSDLIVGAPNVANGETLEGRAYVYHGASGGLSTAAAWTVESNQDSCQFAMSVASAGDVNGDGFSDVIVYAPFYSNGEVKDGRAFLYRGSTLGLSTTATWTVESNQASANTSTLSNAGVACAGDVNADGYSDVLVGARTYVNGEVAEGRVWVFHGNSGGLGTTVKWSVESNQASAFMGYGVACAGDVNDDGYSDVIVGAYQYSNGEAQEGRAYVYHGGSSGLSTTAAWVKEPDVASALFGYVPGGAGDVNGDGYSDVFVGAYTLANGDGSEGRVYVFHGSAAGLSTTAAWSQEGNRASVLFGDGAGAAGDVNADGYSDLVVGALQYDNGEGTEGRAYVYHGSSSGLMTAAAWVQEVNIATALLGRASGTAGDVNGDGFSDVVLSADKLANGEADEGRAYVFHGSEGTVAYNTYHLPWVRRFTVSDAGNARLDKTGSRVVRDSSGFWYVAWQPQLDLVGADILLSYTTTSTPTSAGDWATFTLVDGGATGVIPYNPANTKDGSTPCIAMSPSDELHLVWNAWNDFKYYWVKCTNLAALTASSSWTSIRSISLGTITSNWYIDLAIDSSGTPHIVMNNSGLLYAKSDSNGGAFQIAKTIVSSSKFTPKIAIDLDNIVYVIYHETAAPYNVSLLCSTNAYTTDPISSAWKNLAQTTTDADVVNTPSTTMDAFTAADLCLDYNSVCHVAWRVASGNPADTAQRIVVRNGLINDGWKTGPAKAGAPGAWKRPVLMSPGGNSAVYLFSIANGGPKRDAVYVTQNLGTAAMRTVPTWLSTSTSTSDLPAGSAQALWADRKPWRKNLETMWFVGNDARHRVSTSWTDRRTLTSSWAPPVQSKRQMHPHLEWIFPNTHARSTYLRTTPVVSQTSKGVVYRPEDTQGLGTAGKIYAVDRARGTYARSYLLVDEEFFGVPYIKHMVGAAYAGNVHLFAAYADFEIGVPVFHLGVMGWVDDGTTIVSEPAWANTPLWLKDDNSERVTAPYFISQSGTRYLYFSVYNGTTTGQLYKVKADNGVLLGGFPAGNNCGYSFSEPAGRILNDQVFWPGSGNQLYRRDADGSGEIASSAVVNLVQHLVQVRDADRLFVAPEGGVVFQLDSGLKTAGWASGKSGNMAMAKTSGAYYTRTQPFLFVTGGNQLFRLNVTDGAIVSNWPLDLQGATCTLPVYWKTFVYFGTSSGKLFGVNATSNVARANWPIVLDTASGTPNVNSICVDGVYGHVYFGDTQGRLFKLALE